MGGKKSSTSYNASFAEGSQASKRFSTSCCFHCFMHFQVQGVYIMCLSCLIFQKPCPPLLHHYVFHTFNKDKVVCTNELQQNIPVKKSHSILFVFAFFKANVLQFPRQCIVYQPVFLDTQILKNILVFSPFFHVC